MQSTSTLEEHALGAPKVPEDDQLWQAYFARAFGSLVFMYEDCAASFAEFTDIGEVWAQSAHDLSDALRMFSIASFPLFSVEQLISRSRIKARLYSLAIVGSWTLSLALLAYIYGDSNTISTKPISASVAAMALVVVFAGGRYAKGKKLQTLRAKNMLLLVPLARDRGRQDWIDDLKTRFSHASKIVFSSVEAITREFDNACTSLHLAIEHMDKTQYSRLYDSMSSAWNSITSMARAAECADQATRELSQIRLTLPKEVVLTPPQVALPSKDQLALIMQQFGSISDEAASRVDCTLIWETRRHQDISKEGFSALISGLNNVTQSVQSLERSMITSFDAFTSVFVQEMRGLRMTIISTSYSSFMSASNRTLFLQNGWNRRVG